MNLIYMKAKLNAIIICTCAITLLANCTIEKRVFQKGYHIEWRKKALSENTSAEPDKLQAASDDLSQKQMQEEQAIPDQNSESNSPVHENNESETLPFHTSTKPADETTASSNKINPPGSVSAERESADYGKKTDQKDDEVQPQKEPRKFEPIGIASFVIYFLAVVLGLFAITAANPVVILSYTAVLLILALILGIVSVVKYRKNRDLYERNFFGYFGLIASGSTIILGIFLLILFVLSFLFSY